MQLYTQPYAQPYIQCYTQHYLFIHILIHNPDTVLIILTLTLRFTQRDSPAMQPNPYPSKYSSFIHPTTPTIHPNTTHSPSDTLPPPTLPSSSDTPPSHPNSSAEASSVRDVIHGFVAPNRGGAEAKWAARGGVRAGARAG